MPRTKSFDLMRSAEGASLSTDDAAGERFDRRLIVFVIYEGVNILDLAGPMQVFATASEQAEQFGPGKAYDTLVVSSEPGPVRSSAGARIETSSVHELDIEGKIDTILVAGGHGAFAAARDCALIRWLVDQRARTRRMGSICTGTFVLASAGLLVGRRAATHWSYVDRFQREFADVELEPDAIFCEDGPLWTSAGVTAGLDMALALVERDLGHDIALRTARRLVFYLRRPGGQSQFSVHLDAESCPSSRLDRALQVILNDPAADLALGRLAKAAAMSKRSLIRAFREDLSTTPADYVRRTRLEIACRLLEQSADGLSEIARKTGFGSVAALRRAFQSRFKVSPQHYRDRFRRMR